MGASPSRLSCSPCAALFLKSWIQCDTHEFRSDAEQRIALDLAGWYSHAYRSWTSPHTGARRVRALVNASGGGGDGGGGVVLVDTYGQQPHKFPPPYTPWFAEANKARFPYLFPSLFPNWMAHYLDIRG